MNTIKVLIGITGIVILLVAAVQGWRMENGHGHNLGHSHQSGVLSIDFYAYHSHIRHWNPGFKIGFSVLFLILCIALDNLWASAFLILLAAYVTVCLGGLPFRQYLRLMMIPIFFMVVSSIAIAVDVSKNPAGDFGINCYWFYLSVTKDSLIRTLHLWGKAFGAVSAMYMMSLNTPVSEITGVLRKAHLPAMLVELMNMIYRYIFILLDIQYRMRISAEARMGFSTYRISLSTFGQILGNLFVLSLKKANAYNDAMDARCYDGELLFLEDEKPVRGVQIGLAVFLLIYMGLLCIL